jgi:hypothetical protein
MTIKMTRSAASKIPADNNLKRLETPNTKEIVFGEPYLGGRIQLRVYSTLRKHDNEPRKSGDDAIRVVLYDKTRRKIVDGAKRTHRTKNWRQNLKKRVKKMRNRGRQMSRCKCGGIMIPRGNFLGCSNYPDCQNTQKLNS